MALGEIADMLSTFIAISDKVIFALTSLYFGNLVYKGWSGKKNILIRLVMTVLFGLICFFGGIVVNTYFGWNFPLSKYISSLILAIIFYISIRFISSSLSPERNYVTFKDISALSDEIRNLRIRLAKLEKALSDKKIVPSPLSEEEIKSKVNEYLLSKGIKKHKVLSSKNEGDVWRFVVNAKGKRELLIDSYSGEVVLDSELGSILSIIAKNPLSVVGSLVLVGTIIFLLLNLDSTTLSEIDKAFDFSFLTTSNIPGCYKASEVLEAYKENKIAVHPNYTLVEEAVNSSISGFYIVDNMVDGVDMSNNTLYIATLYNKPLDNLTSEITVDDWSNVNNVRVCILNSNYTLCSCVGGTNVDLLYIVPYLVDRGLLGEMAMEAILSNLPSIANFKN